MYTRLTARGCQERMDWCTRTATSARALEVNATSPSIPAVMRPALRCVTCRTLISVFDRERSSSFCRFLTLGQSSSFAALNIRCRSRSTSRAGPAQTIESQSTASRSRRGRSSGPFTIWCLTCPSVRAVPAVLLQRLTCHTSARFRVPARGAGYPASYTRRPAEGASHASHFPGAFRLPAFASWASCPAREFRPTYDRPTGPPSLHAPDPGEVSLFRTHEIRPGLGVLSTPGTAVATRPRSILHRRLPPLNGRSLPPCAPFRPTALA